MVSFLHGLGICNKIMPMQLSLYCTYKNNNNNKIHFKKYDKLGSYNCYYIWDEHIVCVSQ